MGNVLCFFFFPPWRQARDKSKSISHRFNPILVVFVWELTKETIEIPLGFLQGGLLSSLEMSDASVLR